MGEKVIKYNIFEPWKTLDKWQKKYIETTGNCFLLCGRQSGKTTAASIKFGDRAAKNNRRIILMIAETEKQAYNLFFKTLMYLQEAYPKLIKQGKWKPTKHMIHLKNDSIIMCYAAGLDGSGLRTYTLTDLVIDEAAPMAREIFVATMPMLSVTGGNIDIMSTPRGKGGFFYECSDDVSLGNKIKKNWTRFYISAEDCPRHDKDFLDEQKLSMSELEYSQEYLAKFLDDVRRVFPEKLLKKVCKRKRGDTKIKDGKNYLGTDLAGMGADLNAYDIVKKIGKDKIVHIESYDEKKTLNQARTIINYTKDYNLVGIGVDDGGPGWGVWSELMRENITKRKTIALNNASREINLDGSKSKTLLKVDMYMALLSEMQHKRIELLNDDEVVASLRSIQFEYIRKQNQKTTLRIFGNNTHKTESLIRAVWMALKDKTLNIMAFC